MKVYIYNGEEYNTERQVRQAIFNKERKAFGVCKTETDWAKHGVTIKELSLTPEQLAQQARAKRDALLARCDYYVMPDYPSTVEGLAEVKAYRQALRDITKQPNFPNTVVWPDAPEVLQ